MNLPDTHKAALAWFAERGSDGLIDRYGRVVAQGEKFKGSESAGVWLRLVASGHVMGMDGRLTLTTLGHQEARKLAKPSFNQDLRAGHRGPAMVDDQADDFA